MSDTPRTDNLEFDIWGDYVVLSDECRQIERELNEAKKLIAKYRALALAEMVQISETAGLYDVFKSATNVPKMGTDKPKQG